LAILVSSHVVSRYLPRYRGYRTTLFDTTPAWKQTESGAILKEKIQK